MLHSVSSYHTWYSGKHVHHKLISLHWCFTRFSIVTFQSNMLLFVLLVSYVNLQVHLCNMILSYFTESNNNQFLKITFIFCVNWYCSVQKKTTLLVLLHDLVNLDATTVSQQTSTSTINTGTNNSISLFHLNIIIVCNSKYNQCFISGSSTRFVTSLYYWVLYLWKEVTPETSFYMQIETFVISCMTKIHCMSYRKSLRQNSRQLIIFIKR